MSNATRSLSTQDTTVAQAGFTATRHQSAVTTYVHKHFVLAKFVHDITILSIF